MIIFFNFILTFSDIFIGWDNNTNNETISFSSSFDSVSKSIDLGSKLNIGFKNMDFESKNGENKGSAIRVPRPTIIYHINNTNFKNNSNSKEGGAVFLDVLHEVIVDNCTFENHYSDSNGGSTNIISDSFIHHSNTKSINSTSKSSGGYGYFYTSRSNFSNNWIEKSNSIVHGGGIYLQGSTSNLHNIINCFFADCISQYNGGALFISANNIKISESTFFRCISKYNGGSIYISGSALHIIKICCNNCSLTQSGGYYGSSFYLSASGLQKMSLISLSLISNPVSYSTFYSIAGEHVYDSFNFSYNLVYQYSCGYIYPYASSTYQYFNVINSSSQTNCHLYYYNYKVDFSFSNIINNQGGSYWLFFQQGGGSNWFIIKYSILMNNNVSTYLLYSNSYYQIARTCYIVHTGNWQYYFTNENSIVQTTFTSTYIITHYSTFLCLTPNELGILQIITENCEIKPTPTECILNTSQEQLEITSISKILSILIISYLFTI